MKITTKYDLGDVVYYLSTETIARKKPCQSCGDRGRIEMPSTKRGWVTCPDCGGYSRQGEVVDSVTAYTVKGPLTIGQARGVVGGGLSETTYMCAETGIGSGTVYTEEHLFTSPDWAAVAAAKEGWMTRDEALALIEVLPEDGES